MLYILRNTNYYLPAIEIYIYEWLELWNGNTRYGLCECCVLLTSQLRKIERFSIIRIVVECIISNKIVCFFAHFSAHTRIISLSTNHECASHYKNLVECNLLGLGCGLCECGWRIFAKHPTHVVCDDNATMKKLQTEKKWTANSVRVAFQSCDNCPMTIQVLAGVHWTFSVHDNFHFTAIN